MIGHKMKNTLWFKSLTAGIVCLFLLNSLSIADNGVILPHTAEHNLAPPLMLSDEEKQATFQAALICETIEKRALHNYTHPIYLDDILLWKKATDRGFEGCVFKNYDSEIRIHLPSSNTAVRYFDPNLVSEIPIFADTSKTIETVELNDRLWRQVIYTAKTSPKPVLEKPRQESEMPPNLSNFAHFVNSDLSPELELYIKSLLLEDKDISDILDKILKEENQLYVVFVHGENAGTTVIDNIVRDELSGMRIKHKEPIENGHVLFFPLLDPATNQDKIRSILRHETGHIGVDALGIVPPDAVRRIQLGVPKQGEAARFLNALLDGVVVNFQLDNNYQESASDYLEVILNRPNTPDQIAENNVRLRLRNFGYVFRALIAICWNKFIKRRQILNPLSYSKRKHYELMSLYAADYVRVIKPHRDRSDESYSEKINRFEQMYRQAGLSMENRVAVRHHIDKNARIADVIKTMSWIESLETFSELHNDIKAALLQITSSHFLLNKEKETAQKKKKPFSILKGIGFIAAAVLAAVLGIRLISFISEFIERSAHQDKTTIEQPEEESTQIESPVSKNIYKAPDIPTPVEREKRLQNSFHGLEESLEAHMPGVHGSQLLLHQAMGKDNAIYAVIRDGHEASGMFFTDRFNSIGEDGKLTVRGNITYIPQGIETGEVTSMHVITKPLKAGKTFRLPNLIYGRIQSVNLKEAGSAIMLHPDGMTVEVLEDLTKPVNIYYDIMKMSENGRFVVEDNDNVTSDRLERERQKIPKVLQDIFDEARDGTFDEKVEAIAKVFRLHYEYLEYWDVGLVSGLWTEFTGDILADSPGKKIKGDCDFFEVNDLVYSYDVGIDSIVLVGFNNGHDPFLTADEKHALSVKTDGKKTVIFDPSSIALPSDYYQDLPDYTLPSQAIHDVAGWTLLPSATHQEEYKPALEPPHKDESDNLSAQRELAMEFLENRKAERFDALVSADSYSYTLLLNGDKSFVKIDPETVLGRLSVLEGEDIESNKERYIIAELLLACGFDADTDTQFRLRQALMGALDEITENRPDSNVTRGRLTRALIEHARNPYDMNNVREALNKTLLSIHGSDVQANLARIIIARGFRDMPIDPTADQIISSTAPLGKALWEAHLASETSEAARWNIIETLSTLPEHLSLPDKHKVAEQALKAMIECAEKALAAIDTENPAPYYELLRNLADANKFADGKLESFKSGLPSKPLNEVRLSLWTRVFENLFQQRMVSEEKCPNEYFLTLNAVLRNGIGFIPGKPEGEEHDHLRQILLQTLEWLSESSSSGQIPEEQVYRVWDTMERLAYLVWEITPPGDLETINRLISVMADFQDTTVVESHSFSYSMTMENLIYAITKLIGEEDLELIDKNGSLMRQMTHELEAISTIMVETPVKERWHHACVLEKASEFIGIVSDDFSPEQTNAVGDVLIAVLERINNELLQNQEFQQDYPGYKVIKALCPTFEVMAGNLSYERRVKVMELLKKTPRPERDPDPDESINWWNDTCDEAIKNAIIEVAPPMGGGMDPEDLKRYARLDTTTPQALVRIVTKDGLDQKRIIEDGLRDVHACPIDQAMRNMHKLQEFRILLEAATRPKRSRRPLVPIRKSLEEAREKLRGISWTLTDAPLRILMPMIELLEQIHSVSDANRAQSADKLSRLVTEAGFEDTPDVYDAKTLAEALVLRARYYYEMGPFELSRKDIDRAKELHHENPEIEEVELDLDIKVADFSGNFGRLFSLQSKKKTSTFKSDVSPLAREWEKDLLPKILEYIKDDAGSTVYLETVDGLTDRVNILLQCILLTNVESAFEFWLGDFAVSAIHIQKLKAYVYNNEYLTKRLDDFSDKLKILFMETARKQHGLLTEVVESAHQPAWRRHPLTEVRKIPPKKYWDKTIDTWIKKLNDGVKPIAIAKVEGEGPPKETGTLIEQLWQRRWSLTKGTPTFDEGYPESVEKFMFENISALSPEERNRMIDIGCGVNIDLVNKILDAYPDITQMRAMDVGYEQTALVTPNMHRIRYHRAAQDNTGLPDKSMHTFISTFALEYSPDIEKTVQELYRISDDDSTGLVVIHHPDSPHLLNEGGRNMINKKLLDMLLVLYKHIENDNYDEIQKLLATKDDKLGPWKAIPSTLSMVQHLLEVRQDQELKKFVMARIRDELTWTHQEMANFDALRKNVARLFQPEYIKEFFNACGFDAEVEVLYYTDNTILGHAIKLKKKKKIDPEAAHMTPTEAAYKVLADQNKDPISVLLSEASEDVLLRVSVERIKAVGVDNVEALTSAFQQAPNGYVELFSEDSNTIDDEYIRLVTKDLPGKFRRSTTNTITMFTVLNDEINSDDVQAHKDIDQLLSRRLGGLNRNKTQILPIGLMDDNAGLARNTIIGLRLLYIARQHAASKTVDQNFVEDTVKQYQSILIAAGIHLFYLKPYDIINLATGSPNERIKALHIVIRHLPISPIDKETLRRIYRHTRKVIIAA